MSHMGKAVGAQGRCCTVVAAIVAKGKSAFEVIIIKLEIRRIKEELETPVEIALSNISVYKLEQAIDMFLETPSERARARNLMRALNGRTKAFEKIVVGQL